MAAEANPLSVLNWVRVCFIAYESSFSFAWRSLRYFFFHKLHSLALRKTKFYWWDQSDILRTQGTKIGRLITGGLSWFSNELFSCNKSNISTFKHQNAWKLCHCCIVGSAVFLCPVWVLSAFPYGKCIGISHLLGTAELLLGKGAESCCW